MSILMFTLLRSPQFVKVVNELYISFNYVQLSINPIFFAKLSLQRK